MFLFVVVTKCDGLVFLPYNVILLFVVAYKACGSLVFSPDIVLLMFVDAHKV